jgi:hypothetical protein
MVYTIGFSSRRTTGLSTVRANTAQDALNLAESLERNDAEIRFIDTPSDGQVAWIMLRVLAKEEAGEA